MKIILADGWNHILIGDISDYLIVRHAVLRTRTVSDVIEFATCATTAQTYVKFLPRKAASRNAKWRILETKLEELRSQISSAQSHIPRRSRAATPQTQESKVQVSRRTKSRSPGVLHHRVQAPRVEESSSSESYSEESGYPEASSTPESYPEEDAEDDDALDEKMTQMAWVCKHCAQVTGAGTMVLQFVFRVPPGIAPQREQQMSNTKSGPHGDPHAHFCLIIVAQSQLLLPAVECHAAVVLHELFCKQARRRCRVQESWVRE